MDRFSVSDEQLASLVAAIGEAITFEQRTKRTLAQLRHRDALVQTSFCSDSCKRDACVTASPDCRSGSSQTELDAREDELESLKEYYELELEKQRSQHEMQLFRLKDEQIMRTFQLKDDIDRVSDSSFTLAMDSIFR